MAWFHGTGRDARSFVLRAHPVHGVSELRRVEVVVTAFVDGAEPAPFHASRGGPRGVDPAPLESNLLLLADPEDSAPPS